MSSDGSKLVAEAERKRALNRLRDFHRRWLSANKSADELNAERGREYVAAVDAGVTQDEIAEMFGVSQAATSKLISRARRGA